MRESIAIKEYSEIKENKLESCNIDKLQAYLKCQNLDSGVVFITL